MISNHCGLTLAGYQEFITGVMRIPVSALPLDSPWIEITFCVARDIVNQAFRCLPMQYAWAVYNLAGDRLINYAPDQPGQTYFADIRGADGYNVSAFVPGVVSGASDVSTGDSLLNPDFMKGLTLGDLQNMKTPYGLAYLAIAQDYGPAAWGLS